jgi:hypothetical protein
MPPRDSRTASAETRRPAFSNDLGSIVIAFTSPLFLKVPVTGRSRVEGLFLHGGVGAEVGNILRSIGE